MQQKMLLQMEYAAEKEAFRKLTETIGMQRRLKRGDAWWPVKTGKSYYNSLNQLSIEILRTQDQDIEHNFEFGRPVAFSKECPEYPVIPETPVAPSITSPSREPSPMWMETVWSS